MKQLLLVFLLTPLLAHTASEKESKDRGGYQEGDYEGDGQDWFMCKVPTKRRRVILDKQQIPVNLGGEEVGSSPENSGNEEQNNDEAKQSEAAQ